MVEQSLITAEIKAMLGQEVFFPGKEVININVMLKPYQT
jgi:hypothetical protein